MPAVMSNERTCGQSTARVNDLSFHPVGRGVAAPIDEPPDLIKIFDCLSSELEPLRHLELADCRGTFSAASAQHLQRFVAVHHFTALRLCEAGGNFSRNRLTLIFQPVFAVKLFAEDLERLIQRFRWILTGA